MADYVIQNQEGTVIPGVLVEFFADGVDQNNPGTPLYSDTTDSLGKVYTDLFAEGLYDVKRSGSTITTSWETSYLVSRTVQVAGNGLISLNGLTTTSQTFVDETNLTIVSSGSTHTLTWAGTLAVARGGTGSATAAGARTNLGLGTISTQDANNVAITGGSITGITDLAIADGGTAASTAAQARINLGLAIGTDVQAWDADLDLWALITPPAGDVVGTSGAQTISDKSFVDNVTWIIDNADPTKKFQFQAASIASGQTRTLTVQDTDGTIYVTGGQDVAVADGGTGASDIVNARVNLGLGLQPTDGYLMIGNSGGTYTSGTLTAGSNITITNASGSITISAGAPGVTAPAGSDTQVQFNDGGVFAGDSGLTFNKTLDTLTTGTLELNNNPLDEVYGGTGRASYTQGDLLYASSGTVLAVLAKSTTATRYLSNTGASNNPAWAQIDVTTGITGIVPLANGGTGSALVDPNADRILFWDDSAGEVTWLTLGTGLSITGTTISATGGGGGGTPGGNDTEIQYNDAGAFGGDAGFTYNAGTDTATLVGNFILGGGASASELRFLEPSGSGSNYSAFKAQAQTGNVVYVLPAADATVSGQVLTSDAAGTLSWMTAATITEFQATVGPSGADYTTLGAAVTAGKTRVLIIGTTTESGAVTLSADTLIKGIDKSVAVNMGANTLTTANGCVFLQIIIQSSKSGMAINLGGNNNVFQNVVFQWTHVGNPGAASDFVYDNLQSRTGNTFRGITMIYAGAYANERYVFNWTNSYNNTVDGLTSTTQTTSNKILHSGTGPNAWLNILYSSADGYTATDSIAVDGSYNSFTNVGDAVSFNVTGSRCVMTNLTLDQVSTIGGTQNNVTNLTMISRILTVSGNEIGITNSNINEIDVTGTAGEIFISNSQVDYLYDVDTTVSQMTVNNCSLGGLDLTSDENMFSNCLFTSSITVGSGATHNTFSNCIATGNVTITGNDTTWVGGRVGALAGGGANTITIAAAANRTIINATRTDAAISNSGTDSTIDYMIY